MDRGERLTMLKEIRKSHGDALDVPPVTLNKTFDINANTVEDLSNWIAAILHVLDFHDLLEMRK